MIWLIILILLILIVKTYSKDSASLFLYETIISYYRESSLLQEQSQSLKVVTLGNTTVTDFGIILNNTDSYIFCIDNFIDDNDTYRNDIYQSLLQNITYQNLNNVHIVVGESISISNIWTFYIDILYINAKKDYKYVKSNFITWSQFVRNEGVILIHDIFNNNTTNYANQLLNAYVEGYYQVYIHCHHGAIGIVTKNYNLFIYLSTVYQFSILGPNSLKSLGYTKEFSQFSMLHYDRNAWSDGRNACGVDQIPDIAKIYLKRLDYCYERRWSIELVDTLVDAAKKKIDFSPGNYPFVVLDYYTAISKYPVVNKKVLVAGAVSPWNEAIFIANGASQVVTSEYSNLVSLDPRISVVHAETKHSQKFDVISSFSTIEHCGLGRYGDKIDPNGDFEAINEFHSLLNPDGILFLGIPISGEMGYIQGNYHRVYSYERFYALIEDKFNLLSVIDDHYKFYDQNNNDDWQNQPLFVLQKIK